MKQLAKSYFKAVLAVFVAVYVIYLVFALTILKDQVNIFQSLAKVLLLALLFPLFSKKYLAQIAPAKNLKKFQRTRNYLFIFIGILVLLSILLFLMILIKYY